MPPARMKELTRAVKAKKLPTGQPYWKYLEELVFEGPMRVRSYALSLRHVIDTYSVPENIHSFKADTRDRN
jgi:hypothetical protein